MRIIEQLVYKIQGDNSEFDKSITQSETKVSKFGSVAEKMLAGVTVTAIAMTVKKLGEMAIASATALDRVDKMSQKIGLSREAFQEWDYVLGQSGASVEGLQMGLKTLSSAADEAQKGTLQYKESFDRLGVSVTDVNGNMKDQETLFNEVFFALADMENQTERTAIAADLLGRSATELSPALNTSAEDLEALKIQAHELGLVYEDDLIDAGVILGDNIDALTKSFNALKTRALAPIIGVMVTVSDKLLGQHSASGRLEGALQDLKKTTDDYNKILDDTKGKTDDVTTALINQAKVARQQALSNLSEAYRETRGDIESLNRELYANEKFFKGADTMLKDSLSIMDDFALEVGKTADELNDMNKENRESILQTKLSSFEIKQYNQALEDSGYWATQVISKTAELNKIKSNEITFISSLAQAYIDGDESVELMLRAYPELTDRVMKEKAAIELQNDAMADAQRLFDYELDNRGKSIASLNKIIELYGNAAKKQEVGSRAFLAYAEVEQRAISEKNILLAEEASKEADLAKKEEARKEILDNVTAQLVKAAYLGTTLGDGYDLQSEQVAIYTDAIKALIDSGLNPSDKRVQELRTKLMGLVTTTEDGTKSVSEFTTSLEKGSDAMQAYAQSGLDRANKTIQAYKDISDAGLNNHKSELKRIDEQYNAYKKSGVDITTLEEWKQKELYDLRVKEFDDWANIASQGLGLISDMIESFSAETISKIGSTIKAVGQSTGDATTMAIGMVLELGGQVISFFDDMEERANIWANNMANISNEVSRIIIDNNKKTIDRTYKDQLAGYQREEDAAIEALVSRLSQEEQRELKTQGYLSESKIERLNRELDEAIKNNDTELQNTLQNAIEIQSIRDEFIAKREEAEKDYNKKVAQYEYDKAVLDKQIAVANANISMNKAIADLGWFNWNKKDQVRGLYEGLISAIESTPLPPIPSFNVGSIRIPETTQAIVHKDEMILTAPQAEQARREGITISPNGGGGGNYTFMIYLDGKEIARNTIDNLNSGSVGTIKARMVK